MSIVFVFSWGHCKSQEKLETMLMQNLGGQTQSIMVFSELAYCSMKKKKRMENTANFREMRRFGKLAKMAIKVLYKNCCKVVMN